ncbi:MAG: hypothetical protein JL50_10405 [Peptococcaceae bacterium BICA1-7]|nr:MAG: hypothetical protein JL50_10405 [Peptococcaceae bacterium BICA1-7]HBV95694.1 hypothetical protein [Desulfotomaculum sp.]
MFNDITMLNLGFPENDHELFEQNKIYHNKQLGEFIKKSRDDSKDSTCYNCGTPCTSFCNSHSVPKFCLKKIAVNGQLYYSNTLINVPVLDSEKGINKAGTFRIICRDCDNKMFTDYENPDNYLQVPTGKMLAQIALKNYLMSISKRKMEIAMYNNLSKMYGKTVSQHQTINNLDLNQFTGGFKYAKKATEMKWDDYYFLLYYENLDYIVPIAFQNNIALITDFEGKIINNVYDTTSNYQIKYIHICIFPLEKHSVIIMFIDNGEKRYSSFYKQFKKLSVDDKLKTINYILFSYSEDIFFHKGIDNVLLNNTKLREVAQQTSVALTSNPFTNPIKSAANAFDLNKRNTIPNFLDEANKIK